MRVLISGAGIAGPALAWWLARQGLRPTLVEQAPCLRDGGYAVDFRGRVHLDLLARMGLLDEIRAAQTHMGPTRFVDSAGRVRCSLPADFMAGDLEILRGDLARILYAATCGTADYRFGDQIAGLLQEDGGVTVRFASGREERYDLVVGADGVNSGVRRQIFAQSEVGAGTDPALKSFGYHIAIATIPNLFGLDRTGVFHNAPGLSAGCYAARNNTEAKAVFSFVSPATPPGRHDRAAQEATLNARFAGMGWRTAELLRAVPDAPDLYFDAVSQVRLPRWSAGRVTLLGDAGYCPSPWSGAGTGLAIVGAYVLASALRRAGRDVAAALTAYEATLRPYAERAQTMADGAGDWVAPVERWKLWRRDLVYGLLPHTPWKGMLANIPRRTAEAISLTDD